MKTIFSTISLLLMTMSQLWAQSTVYQYNGVYYSLDHVNGEATVTYASTNYNSYSGIVTIPDYITTTKGEDYDVVAIGDNAFRNSTGVTSVTIATGIETIGVNAFYGCSGLTTIKIPNTVTELGEGAFRDCSNINSVTFSSNLTEVPDYCFAGCSSINTITLPRKVKTLGAYAFQGCSNLSTVSYSTVVTSLGNNCFESCGSLTSTTLPSTVTYIGDFAFYGCSSLSCIKLNEGLQYMGDYMLAYCGNLTEIKLPSTVNKIGTDVFSSDNKLVNANLGSCQITSLPEYTFNNCSVLNVVTLPSTITSIGDYAFRGCSKLNSLTIPSLVSTIGSSTFNGCTSLKQLTFAEGMATIPRTYVNTLQQVTLPSTTTAIADKAFYNCSNLIDIKFPNNLASIGNSAFYGCSTIPTLVLPFSLTNIGSNAFANCCNLTNLEYAEGTRTALRTYATNLTRVTIPSTCEEFADSIFSGCTSLTSIYISDLEMWNYLFLQHKGSSPFACDHYLYLNKALLTDLIADFGAPVASHAFSHTKGLSNITLTATVNVVNDNAFTACTDLQSVVMGNNVHTVGENAFQHCSSLESVRLGTGVTTIKNNAFCGCVALSSMRMGGGERSIGKSVFEGCSALQNIKLPVTLTSLGSCAFKDCKKLTAINLPEGLSQLSDNCFSGCLSLATVSLPAQLTSIGDNAFYKCSTIEIINIPDATETIANNAFNQCKGLNYAYVGRGIKTIDSGAFSNCTMLKAFYCMATEVPTTNSSAFDGADPSSIRLFVPDESASAYGANSPWSNFTSIAGMSNAPIYANSIALDPEVLIMSDDPNDETKIAFTLLPSNATNRKVSWTSSNTSVATVSRTGMVTPVSEGVATITCAAADKYGARATALVIIANNFRPVTSLSLDKTTLELTEGETLQLVAETLPLAATYDVLDWTSSDENVATVSEAGIVTAVNAGEAIITATTIDGTKLKATCQLVVKAPMYASLSSYGDVDGDGWISTDDIVALSNFLLGKRGGIDSSYDINRDGVVTITDITTIIAAIRGQIEMPVGPLKLLRPNVTNIDLMIGESQTITTILVPFRAARNLEWSVSDSKLVHLNNTIGRTCNFTALAFGQVVITATATDGSGLTANVLVNIAPDTGTSLGHDWVDLGLPSKTLWSTCNIGASTPEEYGDYYAWGETTTKSTYKDSNYKWYDGSAKNIVTKYCTQSSYGTVDNKTELELEDDVAHVKWGGYWCMPTNAQLHELVYSSYTTTTWTTENGVYGLKVTSTKNGNSIFLPAGGLRYDGSLSNNGPQGNYWSSELSSENSSRALKLYFNSSYASAYNHNTRTNGLSVRPVLGSALSSISLDQTNMELTIGDTRLLSATVSPSNATYRFVTWSSSNSNVATVSSSGTVTAKSAGSATITCSSQDGSGKTATCIVTVTSTTHDYVDLGLPSGTLWATCNVGASSPEEYGNYYAWGETKPQNRNSYSWGSYMWMNALYSNQRGCNKYTFADGYTSGIWYSNGHYIGTNLTKLLPEDDAATANWGSDWCMPTRAQQIELVDSSYTTTTWMIKNDVYGCEITSKMNGRSIFLPAAGCYDNSNLCNAGSYGLYWSSELNPSLSFRATRLLFNSSFCPSSSKIYFDRYIGQSVRPVRVLTSK